MHRGAVCQFPFRWIYYYGSNKRKGTWQNASLCTGSVVKGELHFCNGYLSLLYFLVVGMHLCLLSQFSNLIKFYKMTSRGDIFAQSRHAFILYFRENQLLFAKPIMYIQKSHYNKFENKIVCLILHQIYCTSLEIVHCVRNYMTVYLKLWEENKSWYIENKHFINRPFSFSSILVHYN